jgi:hypothetical protein
VPSPEQRLTQARRLLRKALVSLSLVVALAACGSGDENDESSPSPAPDGFTTVSDPEAGFSIAVPDDWRQLPLDADTFDDMAGELRAENPRLADVLESARSAIGSGGKLFAIDPDTEGGTNVNLIVLPAPGGTDADLEEVARESREELTRLGASGITQERTSLAGGDAMKATFVLTLQDDDGPTRRSQTQYYLIRTGKAYVLTLTGDDPDLTTVAQSLRIT